MGSKSSTTDASSALFRTVLVGVIRRPHGVRGEVTVEPQTDRPERFEPGSELLLRRPTGSGRSEPLRSLRVTAVRPHRGSLLVCFAEIDDRDAAEALAGCHLEAEPLAEAPEEGVYYHYQLVGCHCRDRIHGELGTVVDVIEDGGGEILVIERAPGEADRDEADRDDAVPGSERRALLLVPFVASYLERIDVVAEEIDFDLPEGLVETCTSTS